MNFKNYLLASAGIMSLSLPLSVPAYAQDDGADDQDDVIVVRGIRRSLEEAVEQKRAKDQIADLITAEDIGKLPDNNIAEALQRVTGVQINRDEAGDGAGFQVRGFSQNRVEVDGRTFAANDASSRANNFVGISSGLFKGVEVIKSPRASDTEGALGATINLQRRKPLDFKPWFVSGGVKGGYDALLDDGIDIGGNLLISTKTDTGAGEVGFLINGVYEEYTRRTDQYGSNGWEQLRGNQGRNDPDLPADGNPVFRPRVGRLQQDFYERTRIGADTSFQWAPDDTTIFTIDASYFYFESLNNQRKVVPAVNQGFVRIDYDPARDVLETFTNPDTGDVNYFLTRGFADASQPRVNPNSNYGEQDQLSFAVSGVKEAGLWTMSFDAQYQEADSFFQNITPNFQLTNSFGRNVAASNDTIWDFTNGDAEPPSFQFNLFENQVGPQPDLSFTNPEGWFLANFWTRNTTQDLTDQSAKLDFTRDFENMGAVKSFQFGARFSNRKVKRVRVGAAGGLLDPLTGEFGPIPYADLSPEVQELIAVFDTPLFPGQGGNNLDTWFSLVNLDEQQIRDLRAVFQADRDFVQFGPNNVDERRFPYNIAEDVYAAYIQTNFEGISFGMPFTGNIGIRFVKTNVDTLGYNAGGSFGSPDAFVEALEFENDYFRVLPSVNLSYSLSENMLLRLAAAKVISRPNPTDLSPGISLPGNSVTASGGNPFLEPFEANQFDASYEWYFDDGALFNVAFFYKDLVETLVSGSFQTLIGNQDRDGSGIVGDAGDIVTVNAPENGGGGRVLGIEVGFQDSFEFLPSPFDGLGAVVNYTFTDSELETAQNPIFGGGLPQENLSRNSANAILFYEKYGLGLRLAYNYRDESLNAVNGGAGLPRWEDSYSQLDFGANYDLTDRITLSFDATNLTGSVLRRYDGIFNATNLYRQTGTRYTLALRGRL